MTTKKQYSNNVNDAPDVVVDYPELEEIFQFQKEIECFKGQWIDEAAEVPYRRQIPPEETRVNLWKAKVIDPKTGKYYTNGEGTGRCLGKEGPKRVVNSIVRLRTDRGEFLLSHSTITGYSAHGDPVSMNVRTPEKYQKTFFRYDTVPNYDTGYSERRNMGPSGSEIIYTLPFTPEAAKALFEKRDHSKENIQLLVKDENKHKVYEVKKPNSTLQENWKMFVESDFSYLYAANYLSTEQKLLNMKRAEGEG